MRRVTHGSPPVTAPAAAVEPAPASIVTTPRQPTTVSASAEEKASSVEECAEAKQVPPFVESSCPEIEASSTLLLWPSTAVAGEGVVVVSPEPPRVMTGLAKGVEEEVEAGPRDVDAAAATAAAPVEVETLPSRVAASCATAGAVTNGKTPIVSVSEGEFVV